LYLNYDVIYEDVISGDPCLSSAWNYKDLISCVRFTKKVIASLGRCPVYAVGDASVRCQVGY
jgi:hypothetical protein